MKKMTENSRRKYTKGIDEEKNYKKKFRGKGIDYNTMITEDFNTEKYSNTKNLK